MQSKVSYTIIITNMSSFRSSTRVIDNSFNILCIIRTSPFPSLPQPVVSITSNHGCCLIWGDGGNHSSAYEAYPKCCFEPRKVGFGGRLGLSTRHGCARANHKVGLKVRGPCVYLLCVAGIWISERFRMNVRIELKSSSCHRPERQRESWILVCLRWARPR